ncbi:MAG: hypothetical protein JO023_09500, partial [Chloroflexi bacterium]|nr:hypothetical protein [Chloroflexota bacterium]
MNRRTFLGFAARSGTAALAAICTASVVGAPTVGAAAAPVGPAAALVMGALQAAQGDPTKPATGARSNVPRELTLISEFISGRNANPENFNPYILNIITHTGLQQAAIEPIQYLNLEEGAEAPWQITGFKFDDGYTGVTMSVRPGIYWSDGQPFTGNDIA